MSVIHLMRHGRTRANELRLYCGATDEPLSDAGVAELTALREAGGYPPLEGLMVYTSGMLRTQRTLEVLYGDVPSVDIPALREIDFGRFEMHSYEELKEDPDYIRWITDDSGETCCPGGESAVLFKDRIIKAFDLLVARGDDCLVICHGGVIASLMAHLFPDQARNFYDWQPAYGRGYTITLHDGKAVTFSNLPHQERTV